MTAIEEPTINAFASSVNTSNYKWTITDTNILGVKYTVYEATLYASYVPDGWNGYIINLNGKLSNINSSWSVKWDDAFKSSASFSHSLGVTATKGTTEGYAIWFASYNPDKSTYTINKS